jgi:hypothetical protein
MLEVKAHTAPNYLLIRVVGPMTRADIVAANMLLESAKLRRGFTVVTDLSQARASDESASELVKEIQRGFAKQGCARVIRVIGERSASAALQFSRTTREGGIEYDVVVVATLDAALKIAGA